ncbi:MAG TPA: hypothetical protein VFT89_05575 [Rhizobiaceae bacterium]|nr:hypothetical protein [Rhizobiaceae bacterium]
MHSRFCRFDPARLMQINQEIGGMKTGNAMSLGIGLVINTMDIYLSSIDLACRTLLCAFGALAIFPLKIDLALHTAFGRRRIPMTD